MDPLEVTIFWKISSISFIGLIEYFLAHVTQHVEVHQELDFVDFLVSQFKVVSLVP